jgi:aminoglycoside phosphotransferase (APT) family kinase protein
MAADFSQSALHPLEAAELIEPRADERIDAIRLEAYLRQHLPSIEGAMSIRQFGGGHANLTYLVRFGEREFVVRRPPLGPVAPGAHDMRREHRVLSVLHRAFPLAPRSFVLCEDETIIGAIFHVLERRRGFAIRSDVPPALQEDPERCRRIGEMLVDTLAALHQVNPAAVGLEKLGRPEGYLDRQLEGWTRRWHAARDHEDPMMDRLVAWLSSTRPISRQATLLHNDFKLDNILLDPADPARPVAVLDWDMSTIGDPLFDLGSLLTYWAQPDDDPIWIEASAMPTWRPGFPSRREAIDRYAAITGFDLAPMNWHLVFGAFKLAVVIQQIYIRFARGQTKDQRFARFDRRVAALIGKGLALARPG